MGNYSEPHCFLAWLQTWSPPRNGVHSLPIFGMKRDVHQLGGKPKLWSVNHFDFGSNIPHPTFPNGSFLRGWTIPMTFSETIPTFSCQLRALRWFLKVQLEKLNLLSARYSGVYPSNPPTNQTSKCPCGLNPSITCYSHWQCPNKPEVFTQPSVDFQVVAGEADGLAVHTSSTLEARVVDSWAEEMGTECLYNELQYNKTSKLG